jgi:alkanesulfonate monooxygenase SsuD/methylene tetrahydromethanopterin reductase-like flavin-dependent oxidoreductase (luciferase family)
MADNGVVAAGGRLTDQITFGVLAASVPRDAVDDAVAAAGKQARRRNEKLPPHVMVYFAMAMALFAVDDYEEVAARLAGTAGVVGVLGRFVERADLGRDHSGPAAAGV